VTGGVFHWQKITVRRWGVRPLPPLIPRALDPPLLDLAYVRPVDGAADIINRFVIPCGRLS